MIPRSEQDRIMHERLVEEGVIDPSATLHMSERFRIMAFGDELDEVISWLTPVQRKALAGAENGIHILNARMPTYRRLKRYGLIEAPAVMRIALLTEDGQEVFRRLNEGKPR